MLEAGAVSETVTVTAEAGETVNTTSGEVARVIDGQQLSDSPGQIVAAAKDCRTPSL
ncbi:MAG: hypothetical protein ACREEM_34480 [Blastocatellia bacterium]